MGIRTVDLTAQNREVSDRIAREFAAVHLEGQYVGGGQVSAFEEEFAAYLGVRRVVGVGSGSDALALALIALGIEADDEVLTVPLAFAGVAESIIRAGAKPVFCDVDP